MSESASPTTPESPGRPRPSVLKLPSYKPGKSASSAAEQHGVANAIKLASNESPWGPLPSVVAKLNDSSSGINRYADSGAREVRTKISEWIAVKPEQVTVGCGSVGLLQQLFLTYVDPGDEVIYPWISFEVYPLFTALMGGVAVNPALTNQAIDLEAVLTDISERTKLIILANPNNPTGTAFSVTELRSFLDKVPAEVVVVLDEAYREFMNPALGDPVHEALADFPNLIVLRTFSKAQGLAALRIGYAVASPELIATLDRTSLPFAINGQAQVAALASIEVHDQIMERVQGVRIERDRIASALVEAGWNVTPSETNFVYLVTGERTEAVALSLEKVGLVTRPFPGIGLRITVGEAKENDRVLAALGLVGA